MPRGLKIFETTVIVNGKIFFKRHVYKNALESKNLIPDGVGFGGPRGNECFLDTTNFAAAFFKWVEIKNSK